MKRFRTAVLILAVMLVSLATMAQPAAAQIWARLGYWPTHTTVNIAGAFLGSWDSTMISLNLRRDINPDWAITFNGDWGAQRTWAGSWTTATSGNDSFWNFNLHRVFMAPTGRFSVFAGYGSGGEGSVFPASASPQTFRVSGFRLGADFMRQFAGAWSVAAWAAFSVGANGTWTWTGTAFPGPQTSTASMYDYGAMVGWTAGAWTIDGGWRAMNLASSGTTNYCNCTFQWTGLTVGVSRSFP